MLNLYQEAIERSERARANRISVLLQKLVSDLSPLERSICLAELRSLESERAVYQRIAS